VPSWSNVVAFSLIALIISVIPGPSVLYSIGRALAWGKRAAVISVLGNATGVGVQILAVALGLGALVIALPPLFFALKLGGALIILWLAIQAIIHSRDHVKVEKIRTQPTHRRLFVQSIGVGITNAKTIVFFVATLPSFVSPDGPSVVLQMLFLGLVFTIIGIASDSVWAVGAGLARDWFAQSESRLVGVRAGGGVALGGLGLYMLYDALAPH
jgi:threonine/homoserine/homoserine lactone efflux protein